MEADESKLVELINQLELRLKWTLVKILLLLIPLTMMCVFIFMAFHFHEQWVMWVVICAAIVSGFAAKVQLESMRRLNGVLAVAKAHRDTLRDI